MIISAQVPFHRLVLSLSEVLDCVHPAVAAHQHRVAYVSLAIARRLGMPKDDLLRVFLAAALHDVGLIRYEDRLTAIRDGNWEAVPWHAEAGYELLRDDPLLRGAADAIRHHHAAWAGGRGQESRGRPVPFASHVLFLADNVARALDPALPALDQAGDILQRIARLAGEAFHPGCVEALQQAGRPPAFWLDLASDRIYGVILGQTDWPSLVVDGETIGPLAATFARAVDAASRWTATHSAGVSASAVALAKRLNFSPRELLLMRAAGYLHDLGKLTVPSEILDSPRKLTPREWNVMKGHTYHTFRILNTIGGMPQVCEWAAFHHERLDGKGYPFGHAGENLTLGSRVLAVADTFTALAEDRPYRAGMDAATTRATIENQVRAGALDGDVARELFRDYDAINAARQEQQQAHRQRQERLLDLAASGNPAPV